MFTAPVTGAPVMETPITSLQRGVLRKLIPRWNMAALVCTKTASPFSANISCWSVKYQCNLVDLSYIRKVLAHPDQELFPPPHLNSPATRLGGKLGRVLESLGSDFHYRPSRPGMTPRSLNSFEYGYGNCNTRSGWYS
jgi:hypothetical protein